MILTPRWSVRTFLIYLVLACLLPSLIGAIFFFVYEYKAGRAQLEKDTLQTARALSQAVDNHLLRAQAVAQSLSTADSLTQNNLARFHSRAKKAITLSGLGTNVVLRDQAGRQQLNTVAPFGSALNVQAAPQQVRPVFMSGRPSVSNLFTGPVLKQAVMSVDVPVVINGKIIYALGVGILPAHFNAILHNQGLPPGWVAAVVDASGTIVGRTQFPERFVEQKAPPDLLEAMQRARQGIIETTTLDGVPVSSFFSKSPATNWSVVIAIPSDMLEAGLRRSLSMLASGAAVLLSIGLALAWLMGGRIARSVKALTVPAIALGNGVSAPVPRIDIKEVADVAKAIGRAASLLQERVATLHAKEAELIEAHRLGKFGTWYWDLLTNLVNTSDSVREIYGRDIPPFPQQRGTLLTVESWEKVSAAMQEAHQTGKGYDLELRVNHGSGNIICINAKCEAIRNAEGQVVALRGMIQDVTGQRMAEASAWKSQQLLKTTMDNFPTIIAFKDQDGHFLDVNSIVEATLGVPKAQIIGKTLYDFLPREDADVLRRDELEVMHTRQSKQAEKTTALASGTLYHLDTSFPLIDAEDNVYGTGHISHDITERKLAEQRLLDAGRRDVLTGLPNRGFVFEYGEHLLAAAARGHMQGALLFIDLDRFKPINDLYGHEIGDRVLQEVGKRLTRCTRKEDLVGRLGGDEFVIILASLAGNHHRATIVAQHVVDSISLPFQIDSLELTISPSIGISTFPAQATEVGALIHAADLAMYQAKQRGRANYQLYTPELNQRASKALAVEVRLRRALKLGGLTLHYQPVMDLISGTLIGAEALVRLEDDGGEAIGPASFIPVAESTGLIVALGAWVATQACHQQVAWRRLGLDITMAINVSPLQFGQRAFADNLSSIITQTGINPAQLEIEVTESTLMENVDDAVILLKRFKSLGVKVALDDFGTGYSSLSSLTHLPLDKLKVDQSFVRQVEHDPASRAVTEAIIALCRSLKLDVHAEGVESDAALRYLQDHHCNHAQGFLFSKPLPAHAFMQWAHARQRVEHRRLALHAEADIDID